MMIKKEYDLMLCDDGITRAVPIVNGMKQDPSLNKPKEKKKEEKPEKPKISIQDRINNQVSDFVSAVEGVIDDFIVSNYKLKHDFYKQLTEAGCKSVHARKMRQTYLQAYNEFVDVYNKDDEYLEEAWGYLKPKTVKKMMDFHGMILDDIDRIIKNASAQRKPRKTKVVSTSKLLKTFKYQKDSPEFKLVSINPEKIIGASELWIFNTRYKTLGVYYAQNTVRGFSVKGCTIQHFDKETSMQKTARKPMEALSGLNKRSLRKSLKDMKTKDQTLTGRINAQTILLGAF